MTMYKKDLIDALKDFPDNYPIWIGAETGDGWSYGRTDEVFVCNATDAPLDGDTVSDWETEYVEKEESIPPEKSGEEFIKSRLGCGEIDVTGPIIVIGIRGSKEQVERNKYERLNRDDLIKQSLLKEKETYEDALKNVNRKLEGLK